MFALFLALNVVSENYHPISCDVTRYVFALVRINNMLKIHGLWPDQCSECITCGYPTCCNMEKFGNFSEPSNMHFVHEYWLNGNNTLPHPSIVCGIKSKTLFEHEAIKHASCMDMYPFDYINIVEQLFIKYNDYVNEKCKKKCNILLDNNFIIINK